MWLLQASEAAAGAGDAAQPSLFRYIEEEQQKRTQKQQELAQQASTDCSQQQVPAGQKQAPTPQQPPHQRAQQRGAAPAPAPGKTGRKYWDVQMQRDLGKDQQPLAQRQASQRVRYAPQLPQVFVTS